ncbi:MAG: class I SAM-dependent methyltransferase [Ramlibacter sp.]
MSEKDRKDYWNRSYLEYWKSRVDETAAPGQESGIVAGDAKTEDDDVYETIFRRHPFQPGSVLDVGCAWGRMFPLLKKFGLKISGIDISKAMIDQAQADWGQDPQIEAMLECEAEIIAFADEKFDNVACLAVFDATFQHRALQEFLRVLRPDGFLYLTGKNDLYPADDTRAMQAEIGARGKNHPNFFTDTASMLRQLQAQGQQVVAQYYFPRRGDFGTLNVAQEMPEAFYEYFIVVQKKAAQGAFQPFSDAFSKTFKQHKS